MLRLVAVEQVLRLVRPGQDAVFTSRATATSSGITRAILHTTLTPTTLAGMSTVTSALAAGAVAVDPALVVVRAGQEDVPVVRELRLLTTIVLIFGSMTSTVVILPARESS